MTTPAEHRLELLVIQPTPFCNLDCDYCYLPARNSTARMSDDVLRRVFEQVLSSNYVRESFTVVWHAGEPLVLPTAFYERAIALIAELNTAGIRIDHSFQTNGTLVTPGWCDFIKRHDIRIGVSVDGPAFLHDARRKTRTGRGTHDRVMRGIACLQQHGIDFHVISVLTRESLDHPDELFQFYVAHGLHRVGFNIEEIEGVNISSSLRSDETSERLRRFFHRFLDLNASSALELREVDGLSAFITQGTGFIDRNQENTALQIISVDCAGNFSTFSPELLGVKSVLYGDFIMGNVAHDDLASIVDSAKFQRISRDVQDGIDKCRRTCEYFGLCGGRSPSNKYFENGTFASAETLHCALSKKAIVDVVLTRLESARPAHSTNVLTGERDLSVTQYSP
jgi:uncharacterized protein